MDQYGSVWISMDQYGSVRVSTDLYGSVRICTDQHGSVRDLYEISPDLYTDFVRNASDFGGPVLICTDPVLILPEFSTDQYGSVHVLILY